MGRNKHILLAGTQRLQAYGNMYLFVYSIVINSNILNCNLCTVIYIELPGYC